MVVSLLTLAGCAARSNAPAGLPGGILEVRDGLATFYGEEFHGKTTASGVRFDMQAMVAAHPTYPFGTLVRVTNLANGRAVQVRIVDRGLAAARAPLASSSTCPTERPSHSASSATAARACGSRFFAGGTDGAGSSTRQSLFFWSTFVPVLLTT